jgi:hypothetical protein
MFNLFKIELLRYRTLALGVTLLNLAALYYLYTRGESVLGRLVHTMWMLYCIGLSAGFAILQMSLHRRDNYWIYLLHRPLPAKQIFTALLSAGIGICLLVMIVPLTVMIVVMDVDQLRGIEARHYQAIISASTTVLTAYGCGCFAALSANRLGFLALSLSFAFMILPGNDAWLISGILLTAWGLLLARVSFQEDLSKPSNRLSTLLLTELPIQYGCLWLIMVTMAALFSVNEYFAGEDPSRNTQAGTDYDVRFRQPKELMLHALEQTTHADANFLRQQVNLGEAMVVGSVGFYSYPQRHQLPMVDSALGMADPSGLVFWQFSHSMMLFEGRKQSDASLTGWLGPDGFVAATEPLPATRFDSVPWVTEPTFILSDDDIYQVDWDAQHLYHRYHSTDDDRFNNSLTVGEDVTTLFSDQSLYLFSSAELRDPTIKLEPKAIMEVSPSDHPDLHRLAVLPLIDGYLVSALLHMTPTTVAPDFAQVGKTHLQLVRLRQQHSPELISDIKLNPSLSDWFVYKEFVLAPGIRLFTDLVWGLRMHKEPERTLPLLYVEFPTKVWLLTGIFSALSSATAAWLLRRVLAPTKVKIFWIVLCAINGVAALLSFVFGYYWWRRYELQAATVVVTKSVSHAAAQAG